MSRWGGVGEGSAAGHSPGSDTSSSNVASISDVATLVNKTTLVDPIAVAPGADCTHERGERTQAPRASTRAHVIDPKRSGNRGPQDVA